jgi:transposase
MAVLPRNKDNYRIQFEKPDINAFIEEASMPMKLYRLINRLDFKEFHKRYSVVGAPSYPAEDMLAVIMLAFSEGIFSSREIEKKCKRDIYFMFLTEQREPDHSKIARFIKKYEKEIATIGAQIIALAQKEKIATFARIAIDGSKFSSASSKKHSMRSDQLERHGKYLQKRMEKTLTKIKETDKKESKEIERLEKEQRKLQEKIEKTERAKKELEERKKLIKDKNHRECHQINIEEMDARMMQPIATNGYNAQLSVDTQTGLIAAQEIVAARSDNNEFARQHEKTESVLGEDENRIYIADSGYISEATFEYIKQKRVNAYINDSREKENKASVEEFLRKKKRLTNYDFRYDKGTNSFTCPNSKTLKETNKGIYECHECEGCELKMLCCIGKDYKRTTKTKFTELREEMSAKVNQDKEKMNARKAVERSFGHIKWNLGFRRFSRKGISGARVELNLLVLSINMVKIITIFSSFFVKAGNQMKAFMLLQIDILTHPRKICEEVLV